MSLRVLDLRGTPPPYEAVLPRPSAPGADVHDVVAAILYLASDEARFVTGADLLVDGGYVL